MIFVYHHCFAFSYNHFVFRLFYFVYTFYELNTSPFFLYLTSPLLILFIIYFYYFLPLFIFTCKRKSNLKNILYSVFTEKNLPRIHVYAFSTAEDPILDIVERSSFFSISFCFIFTFYSYFYLFIFYYLMFIFYFFFFSCHIK